MAYIYRKITKCRFHLISQTSVIRLLNAASGRTRDTQLHPHKEAPGASAWLCSSVATLNLLWRRTTVCFLKNRFENTVLIASQFSALIGSLRQNKKSWRAKFPLFKLFNSDRDGCKVMARPATSLVGYYVFHSTDAQVDASCTSLCRLDEEKICW